VRIRTPSFCYQPWCTLIFASQRLFDMISLYNRWLWLVYRAQAPVIESFVKLAKLDAGLHNPGIVRTRDTSPVTQFIWIPLTFGIVLGGYCERILPASCCGARTDDATMCLPVPLWCRFFIQVCTECCCTVFSAVQLRVQRPEGKGSVDLWCLLVPATAPHGTVH
jgi:hypothetical protein